MYKVGDCFISPSKKWLYIIDRIHCGLVNFTISKEDGHCHWECGEWYLDELIEEGSLMMAKRKPKVKLEEELFTL